jgi:indolepyruvate ferredoxin oxidoreductase
VLFENGFVDQRDYETMLEEILGALTPDNHHLAVRLASIPEKIRGFGHVKARHLTAAKAESSSAPGWRH